MYIYARCLPFQFHKRNEKEKELKFNKILQANATKDVNQIDQKRYNLFLRHRSTTKTKMSN